MFRQSGVIPYRIRSRTIEILLITTSSGNHWGIPKGWISLFMSPADSAAKEAWEEAGVLGSVITPAIGDYQIRKWGYPCQVKVFFMQVQEVADQYPEVKQRQRQWFSLDKAIKRVKDPELQRLFSQVEPSLLIDGIKRSKLSQR
ncbi:NUDIX hydrolase [Pantanalinema sp. GBBB05]|uniref:NUDIX hydrolase n=1 Tax=Pantanalinema sp. GBBB05 TaxID=2604139 RepID=UPI001E1AD11C|nr:NUDIX hydrolase [Pantanalinema sp. GBBB05]